MNDEIIRMAREVGLGTVLCTNSIEGDRVWIGGADWHDELERFYRAAFAAGAAAEREECAKVCEEKPKETFSEHCQVWGNFFARAIRARGKA